MLTKFLIIIIVVQILGLWLFLSQIWASASSCALVVVLLTLIFGRRTIIFSGVNVVRAGGFTFIVMSECFMAAGHILYCNLLLLRLLLIKVRTFIRFLRDCLLHGRRLSLLRILNMGIAIMLSAFIGSLVNSSEDIGLEVEAISVNSSLDHLLRC